MKRKQTLLFVIAFTVAGCFISEGINAQNTVNKKDTVSVLNKADTVEYTPIKITFFLDGKQVPERTVRELGQNGKLGPGTGAFDSRHAIMSYGEKYRYGIAFFSTK